MTDKLAELAEFAASVLGELFLLGAGLLLAGFVLAALVAAFANLFMDME